MNLQQYIYVLQEILEKNGNLRVVSRDSYAPLGAIKDVIDPSVKEIKEKTKREQYEKIVILEEEKGKTNSFVLVV